jgi:hypothetical protein
VADTIGPVADTRSCARCGTLFTPHREHARFCSAKCRVEWNREHSDAPVTGEGALDWSIAAMHETTARLQRADGWDEAHAFTAITEAVWWVTMVDATLVRYHPEIYGEVLAGHDPPERAVIEGTFAGLRFVRNRMGYEADHDDFIQPQFASGGTVAKPIAAWTWRPLPVPDLTLLQPQGQQWETSRYEAYQAQLAARAIGGTFRLAVAFLRRASERSLSLP